MKKELSILLLMLGLTFWGCGESSSGDSTTTTTSTTSGGDSTANNTINTEKLIGTPFEGLTTGDDFDWDLFLCNQYRTETIDTLPIKIFAAFFTESEETIIQEGIDIANEAMGPTNDGGVFYELTDVWNDDIRVIYKVEDVINNGIEYSTSGHAQNVEARFNDKSYAETQIPDWSIELTDSGTNNKWIVAHELGHASGITGHYLIDYENDTFTDLEEDSIMEGYFLASVPTLNDYNYMMFQQATIMQNHLQENGAEGTCAD